MGGRSEQFAPGEVYHVYTRAVDKRPLYEGNQDYDRCVALMRYCLPAGHVPSFSTLKRMPREVRERWAAHWRVDGIQELVEVLSYCLMPNHLHLLLRELVTGGISKYLQRVLASYARYFNERSERTGTLFSSRFNSVHVASDEQLLHVSRYIHLNPSVAGLVQNPLEYPWSSLLEYLDRSRVADPFCRTDLILSMLPPPQYRSFVLDYADYARTLHRLDGLSLEDTSTPFVLPPEVTDYKPPRFVM